MSESSEEKTLPPTAKKLREARKKGQIARNRDIVGSLVLVAGIGFLWVRFAHLWQAFQALLIDTLRVQNAPLTVSARWIGAGSVQLALGTVVPLLIVLIVTAIVASILVHPGVIFALEPIKPQLKTLDPAGGLKRIFGLKALIELAKVLVKALILAAALAVVLKGAVPSLVLIPLCGTDCLDAILITETKLLFAVAAVVFLVVGSLDMLLQRWLFLREMKMSHSELKRENKEQEGDPTLRRAHRQQRQEASQMARTGLSRATLVLRGRDVAVGLRYLRQENRPPSIVCRAKGPAAAMLASDAASRGIVVAWNHDLSAALAKRVPPGGYLPEDLFNPVAKAMYEAGLA